MVIWWLARDALLTHVSRKWEVFHLTVAEGGTATDHVKRQWRELLGENAIVLEDHTKMAEVIVSIMQLREGAAQADVLNSWDGSTSLVVKAATEHLTKRNADAGIVQL